MRRRYQRLVDSLAAEGFDQAAPSGAYLPPELSARQYALALLNVAAQIEHALMVQYLFAAYSLGGPQIGSPEYRRLADEWRAVLLGIAKEEMGHLLTVQNVIRFLGGAPCLERDDYPLLVPGACLHLYGKDDPRRARKMGHLTIVAPTLDEAQRQLNAACAILGIAP